MGAHVPHTAGAPRPLPPLRPRLAQIRGRCIGCGTPSYTAYCDLCAPPDRRDQMPLPRKRRKVELEDAP